MDNQDRTVVLAVVILLGLVAVIGLTGVIWLVHDATEGNAVAAVSAMPIAAIGALAGILAMTRTGNAAAEAKGAEKALAQVDALVAANPPD